MAGVILLENQTADTDGSQDTLSIDNTLTFGKYYTIYAYGTWDGATVTTKISPDGGTTWIAAGEFTTFTEDGAGILQVNPGVYVRGDVTSAGASTDVSLKIL